jgi:hypothetical protein
MIASFYILPASASIDDAKPGLNARRINAASVEGTAGSGHRLTPDFLAQTLWRKRCGSAC